MSQSPEFLDARAAEAEAEAAGAQLANVRDRALRSAAAWRAMAAQARKTEAARAARDHEKLLQQQTLAEQALPLP